MEVAERKGDLKALWLSVQLAREISDPSLDERIARYLNECGSHSEFEKGESLVHDLDRVTRQKRKIAEAILLLGIEKIIDLFSKRKISFEPQVPLEGDIILLLEDASVQKAVVGEYEKRWANSIFSDALHIIQDHIGHELFLVNSRSSNQVSTPPILFHLKT